MTKTLEDQPPGRRSVQRESIDIRLTDIDRDEIAKLRSQLRDMIKAGNVRALDPAQMESSHSSHGDTDGWI